MSSPRARLVRDRSRDKPAFARSGSSRRSRSRAVGVEEAVAVLPGRAYVNGEREPGDGLSDPVEIDLLGGYDPGRARQHEAEQGEQQLSVFSDYENADEHLAGNLIEANVFQEQTIGPDDVDKTWVFEFQAKKPAFGGVTPPTTALAFIKTIDAGDNVGREAW